MEWQKIETAPKDSAILLWFPDYPDIWDYACVGIGIGTWKTNPRNGHSYFSHVSEMDDYSMEQHPPTHWMPLPAPPSQEK